MKKYLFIALMLISRLCFSQPVDINTRPAFELKLFVSDSNFYKAAMPATSYVIQNKIIQIFPGEEIFIEADIVKDSLVNLKRVSAIVSKKKTLTISFTQISEGKAHKQMELRVSNPFSKNLEYSAQMNLMKQKRWVKTDVLPVRAGIQSFEFWPDVITTMALSDLYLKD
ncbi:hypothetical protein SAMN05216464_104258 [Mucilaginibacter pineti]|uniref:DUF4139 domain-containing protein n=1 Tax=Mucilaginibacter pineti TaxID=1391627 RepID=A0A1G7AWN6_9SPHI|nr:hypothetical protein [Mucilaginibacter pineti]SDE18366.1 hypothetical protein SAMN05216464_104258 [Mucilaginibacter pineti]